MSIFPSPIICSNGIVAPPCLPHKFIMHQRETMISSRFFRDAFLLHIFVSLSTSNSLETSCTTFHRMQNESPRQCFWGSQDSTQKQTQAPPRYRELNHVSRGNNVAHDDTLGFGKTLFAWELKPKNLQVGERSSRRC